MDMEFQLVVTEKCNMGCKYCYMNNNPSHMTIDTFDKFYDKIDSYLDLFQKQTFHLALFGGEPLYNWDLCKYAAVKANNNPKCSHVIMMTNGILLNDKKIKWLKDNNVSVGLSFDGLSNQTDRILKSGKSSLDIYLKRKDFYKQYFHQSKVMISPDNAHMLCENYLFFINDMNWNFPGFSIVRDRSWNTKSINIFKKQLDELIVIILDLWNKNIQNLPAFLLLYMLDTYIGDKHGKRPFGCFAGCGGMGFMPNGKAYPCARFGSADLFPLYNVNNDEWLNENIDFFKSNEISNPQYYPKCRQCELYKYCNAGCTFSQLLDNSYVEPIDEVCEILKLCYNASFYVMDALHTHPEFVNYFNSTLTNMG